MARLSGRVLAGAGIVALVALAWHHMAITGDGFWMIASGRWMLAHGIPHTDPFTYASSGDWMLVNAASCALFAAVAKIAGLYGLLVLGTLVEAGAVALLWLGSAKTPLARAALLPLVLFFIQVDADDLSARGQIFGDLAFVLLLGMLARLRDGKRLHPAWIAVFVVTWTNLHMSFLAAIALPAFVGVVALTSRETRGRARPFFVFAAIATASTLATPYGWGYLRYTIRSMTEASTLMFDLFHSPDFHDVPWLVAPALAFVLATRLTPRGPRRPPHAHVADVAGAAGAAHGADGANGTAEGAPEHTDNTLYNTFTSGHAGTPKTGDPGPIAGGPTAGPIDPGPIAGGPIAGGPKTGDPGPIAGGPTAGPRTSVAPAVVRIDNTLYNRSSFRLELAVLLLFVVAACRSRRYATGLVGVEVALAGPLLDAALPAVRRGIVEAVAGAAAVFGIVLFVQTGAKDPLRDVPADGTPVARAAADPTFGGVVAPLHWGGYLAYAWMGTPRYMIDGRDHIELFGNGAYDDATAMWNGLPSSSAILDVYDARVVIWERGAPLDLILRGDPHWRLTYESPLDVVFVRR